VEHTIVSCSCPSQYKIQVGKATHEWYQIDKQCLQASINLSSIQTEVNQNAYRAAPRRSSQRICSTRICLRRLTRCWECEEGRAKRRALVFFHWRDMKRLLDISPCRDVTSDLLLRVGLTRSRGADRRFPVLQPPETDGRGEQQEPTCVTR
jgi:hypothetical protein